MLDLLCRNSDNTAGLNFVFTTYQSEFHDNIFETKHIHNVKDEAIIEEVVLVDSYAIKVAVHLDIEARPELRY